MANQDLVKQRDMVSDYLKAMVNLYGVIAQESALAIINSQNELDLTPADLDSVNLYRTFVETESGFFVHQAIFYDDTYQDVLAHQGDLPFYIPEKSELLEYSAEGSFEWDPAYEDLRTFLLQELSETDSGAKDICTVLQLEFSMNAFSVPAIIEELQRHKIKPMSTELFRRLMIQITNAFNHTRRWDNRGWTSLEVFEKFGTDTRLSEPDLSYLNQMILCYVSSLVMLNGAILKEKVREIFNSQNFIQIQAADMDSLDFSDHFLIARGDYFIEDSLVSHPDELKALLQAQEGKPYYVHKRHEFLYAGEFYTERQSAAFGRMAKFIQNHSRLNAAEVQEVSQMIALHCCTPSFSINKVMQVLENRGLTLDHEKEHQTLVQLIFDLADHSRLWINRGHTPAEIRALTAPPVAIKTGRNDPCPCGSGKKYKHCCGQE